MSLIESYSRIQNMEKYLGFFHVFKMILEKMESESKSILNPGPKAQLMEQVVRRLGLTKPFRSSHPPKCRGPVSL
jgi:hypothetical protein